MNNEQLDDLKQFIDGKISQSEENIGDKIEELKHEMQDGFSGVGEAVDQIHVGIEGIDERVQKLEQSNPTLTDQAA